MMHGRSIYHAQKINNPLMMVCIAQGAAVVDEEVVIRGDESVGVLTRLSVNKHTI